MVGLEMRISQLADDGDHGVRAMGRTKAMEARRTHAAAAGSEATRDGEAPAVRNVLRVFMSSTFRDMQAEREELVKRVFPALRARCEARGVTWGAVDLRWGITHAEAREGNVLPICLAEIDGCRPYFLGMLGDRYGWVPDAINSAVAERFPWLPELAGRSVTEMEFRYGAMTGPSSQAFFYLRDPSWLESLPGDTDRTLYLSNDETSRALLAALKDEIRASYPDRVRVYADPEELGRLVEADLTGLIERSFDPEPPTPGGQDRAAQEVLLRRLAGAHVGRESELRRLDAHVSSDRGPAVLVVTGDPGAGKTSLLAAWVMRRRTSGGKAEPRRWWFHRVLMAVGLRLKLTPGTFDLTHFAGTTAGGAGLAPVLQGFIDQLGAQFGFRQEVAEGATAAAATFANALGQVAASSRVLLVIDGLDRLDPRRQGLCARLAPGRMAPRRARRGLRRTRPRPRRADASRLAHAEGRAPPP